MKQIKRNEGQWLSGLVALTLLSACSNTSNGLKNGTGDPNADGNLQLSVVGDTRVVLAPTRFETLSFILAIGGQGGQPVPGARITFSIQGSGGGAFLSKDTDTTGDDGQVHVQLTAGPSDATFQVVAQTEGTEPARVDVDVNGIYAGNIVVDSAGNQLPTDLRIAALQVRLHDGRVDCSTLNLDSAPAGLPAVIEETNVASVAEPARFNGLTENSVYIATVVAVNALGKAVAVGCGGPATVQGQRDTVINVQLRLAAASAVGTYQYAQNISPLDFMNPNTQAYSVIYDILHLLNNPSDTIMNHWMSYDSASMTTTNKGLCVGASGLGAVACAGAGAAIPPLVMALLDIDSSGTATLAYEGINDAAGALLNLHVGGTLNILTHDPTTGNITATLGFDSFNFIWRAQPSCNPAANPPPAACCGHNMFDATTDGFQPFFKACADGPASSFSSPCADLTGTVTAIVSSTPGAVGYNLQIGNPDPTQNMTTLSLAYGSLVVSILEGLVLPNVLNPTQFPGTMVGTTRIVKIEDMLTGLLNCDSIQDSVSKAACQGASGAIGTIVNQLIAGLSFNGTSDWNAKIAIAGQLTDTDEDRQVDTLSGTVTIVATAGGGSATSESPSIQALLNGTPCTGDKSCGPGMACRLAKNPLDNCFAATYCGVPDGNKVGDDVCQLDDECYSGVCMKAYAGYSVPNANHCYQACKADADCATNGHCSLSGMIEVESSDGGLSASPSDVVTYSGTCVIGSTGATGPI